MATIWAKTALLPTGWKEDVTIELGNGGRIASIECETPRIGETVSVLLPSPVNVHSHSFQRAMAGLTERRSTQSTDSFWTWRDLMFRFLNHLTPDHIEAISAFVQMEMLEAGYSTNAEFHYLHHQPGGTPYANLSEMSDRIAAATETSGIGLCFLPVHYQYGGCDQRALTEGQIRFGNSPDRFAKLVDKASEALKSLPADTMQGVAPHSLRAVSAEQLGRYGEDFPNGPIHMHLAEQGPEVEEVLAHWGARPVEWVLENMAIDERWCLIHCTQMTPEETKRLAQTQAVAGLCPITESSLGDGIFDGMRWLEASGKLAIGSDSNIRISLSEELRTLDYSQRLRDHTRAPFATSHKSTGRQLFEMMLQGGAQATARNTGALRVGAWADMLALDVENVTLHGLGGDALLDAWVFSGDDTLVTEVWSAGRHLVTRGQHVAKQQITHRYLRTLDALRDIL